jgi:hypothetical protein
MRWAHGRTAARSGGAPFDPFLAFTDSTRSAHRPLSYRAPRRRADGCSISHRIHAGLCAGASASPREVACGRRPACQATQATEWALASLASEVGDGEQAQIGTAGFGRVSVSDSERGRIEIASSSERLR